MSTTFVKGDFLAETPLVGGARTFAFAADVSGEMDAGIAVAMKRRWPALAAWWADRCAGGKVQLGDAARWKDGDDVVYALAIEKRGAPAKVSWLERALQSMTADATNAKLTRVSVPRLWGGATGLDPARAKRILQEVGDASSVSLVVFEQFIRAKEGAAPPSEVAVEAAEPSAPAPKKSRPPAPKKQSATKKKAAGIQKSAAKKKAAAAKRTTAPAKKKKVAKKKPLQR